jgi:hypothetical protein
MKAHRMRHILYIDVSCGILCSTALSIGVVSARGSIEIFFDRIYRMDRIKYLVNPVNPVKESPAEGGPMSKIF